MEEWSSKYYLGIEGIDKQHEGFFDLWDKECNKCKLGDTSRFSLIIQKLEDYIIEHFKLEEEVMKRSAYKDIDSHINAHHLFIQKVEDMKQEQLYMNAFLAEKIGVFMKKWFLNHIIQVDKKYQMDVINYLEKQK